MTKHYLLFSVLWLSTSLEAARLSYTLSGSGDRKFLGYYSQRSLSGSAAVDMDLGRHLRIGLSHSQQRQEQQGYRANEDESDFKQFTMDTKVVSNAVNLTVIPYNGYLTPFVFVGLGRYHVVRKEIVDGEIDVEDSIFPGPQGGVGVGIRLSRKFSLKITHTLSFGSAKSPLNKEGESRVNELTQIGITYRP